MLENGIYSQFTLKSYPIANHMRYHFSKRFIHFCLLRLLRSIRSHSIGSLSSPSPYLYLVNSFRNLCLVDPTVVFCIFYFTLSTFPGASCLIFFYFFQGFLSVFIVFHRTNKYIYIHTCIYYVCIDYIYININCCLTAI